MGHSTTWASKLQESRRTTVHRITVRGSDGHPAYYFVLPFDGYAEALSRVIAAGGAFRLDTFGQVLAWGKGTPDETVLDELRQVHRVIL